MTISVPDSAKAMIDEQAARAGYSDSGDYLLSLVERDRNRAIRDEIESKLAEAIASESSPLTRQDWENIRQQGRQIVERPR
jgi:hypothetical protein